MPYVSRNSDGAITAVHVEQNPAAPEYIEPSAPELRKFLDNVSTASELQQSDQAFIRVLEDVIYLLIDKGVIVLTDLPVAAQRKLSSRRSLRGSSSDLGALIGSTEDFLP